MIYFLTDWQLGQDQLESNVIFNVNKAFQEEKIETKIINTQLSPFLNYFMNQFDSYDANHFINIIDSVADCFALSYAPLTLRDLVFPKDWERTFTRTTVLFSKNGIVKAEVFFNSFGFVSQVHYYTTFNSAIHTYSEKGYILSKKDINLESGAFETSVFDEFGRLIFIDFGDYISIGDVYKKVFNKSIYASFQEICTELISSILVKFNPKEDTLVIDGTNEWLISLVENFAFPESIIYLFSGPTQVCINQMNNHSERIKLGKCVITDNFLFYSTMKKVGVVDFVRNGLLFMPFYPTTLMLGESNHFLESYVYWQIKKFDFKISKVFEGFLKLKLTTPTLCLIIESEVASDEMEINNLLTIFVSQSFEINIASPEYILVKEYYEALKNEEMTSSLRDLFQEKKKKIPEFDRIIAAYLFYTGISFKQKSNIQALKEVFQKVRVFVDQRENYEFQSHSLAVSAGIPILSKTYSPYLIENRNGEIYEEDDRLVMLVHSYLSDLDSWNKCLVESVEIIESNSSEDLVSKWMGASK